MMMPHGSVGRWRLQHTRVEWPIHWRTLNLPPSLHPQLGLLLTAYTLLQVLWRREIKMYKKFNFDELYKWYIFVSCSLGTVVLVINFFFKSCKCNLRFGSKVWLFENDFWEIFYSLLQEAEYNVLPEPSIPRVTQARKWTVNQLLLILKVESACLKKMEFLGTVPTRQPSDTKVQWNYMLYIFKMFNNSSNYLIIS